MVGHRRAMSSWRRTSVLCVTLLSSVACGSGEHGSVSTAPPDTGPHSVDVDFRTDTCPHFTGFSIDPSFVRITAPSTVTVFAKDPEGDDVFYVWSATAGRFTNIVGPVATFHCDEAGSQTISVAAFDRYGCDRVLNIITSCAEN